MDELDRAQMVEDQAREDALRRRMPVLLAAGACHNCGERLGHRLLFCDTGCRDDWQVRMDAARRAGRA